METKWLPADWLIVGEPFDAGTGGGAGAVIAAVSQQERLLFNMLQAVRVSRDAPARDARACHFALGGGAGQRLDAALEGVRPRLILALGRVAAEALLGVDEPLGRLRGKVHERAGIRVIVSFPLAYLLRNPAEKAKVWADLCVAVRSLEAGAG
ncbi:MAG: uracil-DNA glycosylase family protein [Caldimonas sp.]